MASFMLSTPLLQLNNRTLWYSYREAPEIRGFLLHAILLAYLDAISNLSHDQIQTQVPQSHLAYLLAVPLLLP